jgi:hypothetical protein
MDSGQTCIRDMCLRKCADILQESHTTLNLRTTCSSEEFVHETVCHVCSTLCQTLPQMLALTAIPWWPQFPISSSIDLFCCLAICTFCGSVSHPVSSFSFLLWFGMIAGIVVCNHRLQKSLNDCFSF